MSVDFDAALASHGLSLARARPEILQLNVGKLCNLTCVHCHVNAGPQRTEIITGETVDRGQRAEPGAAADAAHSDTLSPGARCAFRVQG